VRRPKGWPALAAATLVAAAAGVGAIFALDRGSPRPQLTGETITRRVPELPLQSEAGKTMSLAAFRGKVVVLTPFLTLCHEVCPLTTGAFLTMQRDVERAGLTRRVVFVEVSVDPWRDSPARLRAFARMTGVHFPLLTGTSRQLARFWRFFEVASWRTKEGVPADIDWLTGKPLTFDVSHTDGLFLLDAAGRERIVDVGMPTVQRPLPRTLKRLLNAEGRHDLADSAGGWTVQQGLDDVGYLLGVAIPAVRG
jgi:protein SCO1/2